MEVVADTMTVPNGCQQTLAWNEGGFGFTSQTWQA